MTAFYDAEGRISKVEMQGAGTLATYDYDADGRRVKRTVGTNTTYYVYDADGQLMAEYGGPSPDNSRRHGACLWNRFGAAAWVRLSSLTADNGTAGGMTGVLDGQNVLRQAILDMGIRFNQNSEW